MDVVELVKADGMFHHLQLTFSADPVDVQWIKLLAILLLWSRLRLERLPTTHDVCNKQQTVQLVSWSLTSPFSTNTAISETKGQGWRAIPTQSMKASDILTSTLAAFLFSSHPKRERDRDAHLNYYASEYKKPCSNTADHVHSGNCGSRKWGHWLIFNGWWSVFPPLSLPMDSIWALMTVWRLRGEITRTVLCCIVYDSCAQWYDTICALKGWRDGQPNLVHNPETKNKEKLKTKTE